MSGAGYLYGATSVAPRTTTILSTKSAAVSETATIISTATWTETTYLPTPSTGQPGPWTRTTDYPLVPGALNCVASGGFIYCVGGLNETARQNAEVASDSIYYLNRTYYASLSPTGVGHWMRTTDYPVGIFNQSCVASSNYIYCVGGSTSSHGSTGSIAQNIADVYYTSLSPSGIGLWKQAGPYPYLVAPHCMTDSGYIFCVSPHYNGTAYTDAADSYFAQLSAAGVGNWTLSSQPPAYTAGCSASGGYAYCFGGGPCSPPGPCPSPSYYAPLSPDGVGVWTRTTSLPASGWANYVTGGSYVYYFTSPSPNSSPSYFLAHLSSNGIGPWTTSTTPYPEVGPMSCVVYGAYLYCIGGLSPMGADTDSVYFTQIG